MKAKDFWKVVGKRAGKGTISIFLAQLVVVAAHNPLWIWLAPVLLAIQKAWKESNKNEMED